VSNSNLQIAREHYKGMREILLNERSGWNDEQIRFVIRVFCDRARPLVGDLVCKTHLDAVAEYVAAQWPEAASKKWEASRVSRTQFLRQQILRELDAYAARLDVLETAASQEETWRGTSSAITR